MIPPTHFIIIADLLHMYIKYFSTCYCASGKKDTTPTWHWYLLSEVTRNLVGQHYRAKLWDLIIETSPTLHTDCMSSSYIYNVCQHLLLQLQVIKMQLNLIYLCLVSQSTVKGSRVGDSLGFAMGFYCYVWLISPIQFILIAGLLYTYIKCFSTFNSGYRS
jgi:hypothetical protein